MSLIEAVEIVLGQYAVFSGRARRSEFWYYNLFCYGVNLVMLLLVALTGSQLFTALYGLWILAVFIPTLAVSVRRLHDTGRSGWYFLFLLIPAGGIILLVWSCQDSQPGANMYGPNPKGVYGGRPYAQNPYGRSNNGR